MFYTEAAAGLFIIAFSSSVQNSTDWREMLPFHIDARSLWGWSETPEISSAPVLPVRRQAEACVCKERLVAESARVQRQGHSLEFYHKDFKLTNSKRQRSKYKTVRESCIKLKQCTN